MPAPTPTGQNSVSSCGAPAPGATGTFSVLGGLYAISIHVLYRDDPIGTTCSASLKHAGHCALRPASSVGDTAAHSSHRGRFPDMIHTSISSHAWHRVA